MKPILSINISTIIVSINNVPSKFSAVARDNRVDIGLVVQGRNQSGFETAILGFIKENNLNFVADERMGLSRSRNLAMTMGIGEFIYFSDDDVEIDMDRIVEIATTARRNDWDIAAFKVSQGNANYKRYPTRKTRINIWNAARLHSANFIVSRSFLLKTAVKFPEDMGLGTDLPSGEEYVFLANLLKQGAKGWFLPVVAVDHPDVSSGQSFPHDLRDVRSKRIMLDRIFGKAALLYRVLFALKKVPQALGRVSLQDYFGELIWRRAAK